jgi:hypothetical protein
LEQRFDSKAEKPGANRVVVGGKDSSHLSTDIPIVASIYDKIGTIF